MAEIVPTVLASTPDDYKASLQRIHTFAKRVHVDFSDGTLAPSRTIEVSQIWWPQEWKIDIHVMANDPSLYIQYLTSLRPNMIIVHAEATGDLATVIQQIKSTGVKAGVSLQKSTVPADVSNLISAADHVMIFSGDLGKYGGTASLLQLEKIRLIKNINNAVEIGWDGGINIDNIFSLVRGDVAVLNVGGALQKADDAEKAYNDLLQEINRQGVM